jgi:hypothetical protein
MMAYPIGGKNGGSTITFLLVVVGVVSLWRTRRDLLILLLGALPFTFIAACLQRYPYGGSARLAQHVAASFCLLAAAGLMTLFKSWIPLRNVTGAVRISALVMIAITVGGITRDLLKPFKHINDQENRRAIRWLVDNTAAGDQWISFNKPDPNITYADNLYARGGSGARHRFYLITYTPVPLLWAPEPQAIPRPQNGRTWLIALRDNRAPFPEKMLDKYVRTIAEAQGAPQRHVFPLPHKKYEMELEIYEFPKVAGSQPAAESPRP